MNDLCTIKTCGDSTHCEICGLAWDTNDNEPGCAIIPNSPAELAVRNALALGEKRGAEKEKTRIIELLVRVANECRGRDDKAFFELRQAAEFIGAGA